MTRTALDGEIRLAQKLSLEESAAAGVPSPSSLPRINSSRDGGGDHTRDFASNTSADEQESAPDSESNSSDNSQSSESNEASATESVNEGSAAAAPIPLRRSTRIRQPTHFYGKVNGNLAQARGAYINSLLLGCNIEKVIDEALEQQSSTSLTATNAPATSSPVSTSTHAHHIAIMDLDVSLNSASSAVSSSSPSTIAPAPRIVLPRTFEEAWRIPEWREAIKKEYEAHAKNGTWKIVPLPKGRKAIGWKLVFRIKLHADGSIERYKARLTGKGYAQLPGLEYTDTFAPTLGYITLRVFLVIVASEDLELSCITSMWRPHSSMRKSKKRSICKYQLVSKHRQEVHVVW